MDGDRESKLSWMELYPILEIAASQAQGTKCAIGDGGFGFWSAIRELVPRQKNNASKVPEETANILDKMPKSVQPKAKEDSITSCGARALVAYNAFLALMDKV